MADDVSEQPQKIGADGSVTYDLFTAPLTLQSDLDPILRLRDPIAGAGRAAGVNLEIGGVWEVGLRTVQDGNHLELFEGGAVRHAWNSNDYFAAGTVFAGALNAVADVNAGGNGQIDGSLSVGVADVASGTLTIRGLSGGLFLRNREDDAQQWAIYNPTDTIRFYDGVLGDVFETFAVAAGQGGLSSLSVAQSQRGRLGFVVDQAHVYLGSNLRFVGGVWTQDNAGIDSALFYGHPYGFDFYRIIAGLGLQGPLAGFTTAGYVFEAYGNAIHAGAFVVSSDRRFKRDVAELGPVLPRLRQLRAVRFRWNRHYLEEVGNVVSYDGRHLIGLVAQDVEEAFPELVDRWARRGVDDYRAIDYGRLAVLGIAAAQELDERVTALEAAA